MNTQTQIIELPPAKAPAAQTVQPYEVMMNDEALDRLWRVAQIMADSKITIPKDLQSKVGDCFAVCMQAAQWGMNPFSVAQKTHVVNGTLGYEAQLVNAVITTRAPIKNRLNFEWYGDWSKVNGKEDKSFERGIVVSATLKGEDEPRELNISMGQVGNVRNSPNWVSDPRQQLAYLAIKRWARLYCPDVILGVYTKDELEEPVEKDITPSTEPAKPHSGSSALKDRLKGRSKATVVEAEVVESKPAFDVAAHINAMQHAESLEDLMVLARSTPSDIDADSKQELKAVFVAAKSRLSPRPEPELEQEPQNPAQSLAARVQAAQSNEELDQLASEIGLMAEPGQTAMWDLYNYRMSELNA